MKFPGGDHLRRLKRELFPTEADHEARLAAMSAEVDAEVAARRSAKEAEVNDLRRACAGRLTPYIGRLFLVSNFKEVRPEENAARISGAVLAAANFGAGTPIGISAVLSSGRGNHESLVETADALTTSFASSIGECALSLRPQRESSDLWLLSLARAAEDTARRANVPPEELGCVAAVSALEMNRQANIPYVPAPGTAFMLTHIDDIRFGWETISVPDYQ
jgi:hypothetical protein